MKFRWEAVRYLLKSMEYINKFVDVVMDRPMGTAHPQYKDMIYKTNYGYVPNTISGDGEELDCYILGINEPLERFTGKCIAVIHRLDDNDEKLVIVPDGREFTDEQIKELTNYQEKYFISIIIR